MIRACRSRPPPPSIGALGAAALVAVSLAGCTSLQSSDSFLGIITPYRLEVVQGNVITREQAALVKPGMTRAQIRDVLGSPLLMDPFHTDRWDYVFTIRRQGAQPQARQVVVRFNGDILDSIDTGGELPGEREFVASIDVVRAPRAVPTLTLSEAQLKALPAPQAASPTAAASAPPQRNYPPLEPRS